METTEKTQATKAADKPAAEPTVNYVGCEKCGGHSHPKREAKEAGVKVGLCEKCRAGEFKTPTGLLKTAEEWATQRGHFPETVAVPGAEVKNGVMPPRTHNRHFAKYQQARFHSWGGVVNKEMTLAEYDAGVAAAETHVFR